MKKKRPRFHEHRAARASVALVAYQRVLAERGPVDTSTVRDLLQDMLHWLAQNRNRHPEDSLREACETACRDFPRELKEDEDR